MSRSWKATFVVVAGVTVLGIAYHRFLRPWHQHWGLTSDELSRSWPGDELVPNACGDATHAITINASASQIWPWIVQIGQDRAGFYATRGSKTSSVARCVTPAKSFPNGSSAISAIWFG
jgi:hypothetical protein